MARAITIGCAALCLLLFPLPALAHHGDFYQKIFRAVKKGELDAIKHLFKKAAWEGTEGAMSAVELQERLKKGRVKGLFENSQHDEQRSKCLVAFKLEYPDQKVERIWLLAKDFDPRFRVWDWRIVRIVNDEKEAQSFFKHSYSPEFSGVGKDETEAAHSINPPAGVDP
jgi:hypothetical protein